MVQGRRALPSKALLGVLGLTALLLVVSLMLALRRDSRAVAAAEPQAVRTPAIVFVCGKAGHDLCRVDPSGRGLQQLTRDGSEAEPYASPSLTPDGRWLAFIRGGRAYRTPSADLNSRLVLDDSGDAIAVSLHADGQRALVTREVVECIGGGEVGAPCRAIPSLVISEIWEDRVHLVDEVPEAGRSDWLGDRIVGEVPIRGRTSLLAYGPIILEGILPEELIVVASRYSVLDPDVSPDGAVIAATRSDNGRGGSSIMLFSTSTRALLRTLDTSTINVQPSWSPNGREIVFTRNASLYAASANGGEARSLGVRGREPTWGG